MAHLETRGQGKSDRRRVNDVLNRRGKPSDGADWTIPAARRLEILQKAPCYREYLFETNEHVPIQSAPPIANGIHTEGGIKPH